MTTSSLVWSERRVFVTPAPGCPSRCAFCYLDERGDDTPHASSISGHSLARMMTANERFVTGAAGTVISLGCLSDPLAPHAIASTIDFLRGISSMRNPVQLSTRWVPGGGIDQRTIYETLRQAGVVVFHSLSTISHIGQYERGTPSLERRMHFMAQCGTQGIAGVLYIKPFLSGVTEKDTQAFVSLAKAANLSHVVIGPMYRNGLIDARLSKLSAGKAGVGGFQLFDYPVSANRPLESPPSEEVVRFGLAFQTSGLQVFHHSTEALASIGRAERV